MHGYNFSNKQLWYFNIKPPNRNQLNPLSDPKEPKTASWNLHQQSGTFYQSLSHHITRLLYQNTSHIRIPNPLVWWLTFWFWMSMWQRDNSHNLALDMFAKGVLWEARWHELVTSLHDLSTPHTNTWSYAQYEKKERLYAFYADYT